ncbi:Lcl C-terminal domain-containing protein [Desulfothermus sp.]
MDIYKKVFHLFIINFILWIFLVTIAKAEEPRITCYNQCTETPCPEPDKGEKFYGYGQKYDDLLKFLDKKKINGELVVVDSKTNLMWQQATADTDGDGQLCHRDKVTWIEAKKYCENLNLAGFTDWRLPTLFELFSIVSPKGGGNPVINACCFKCRICSYWSATPVKNQKKYVWEVYLYNGNAYWADKDSKRYVLCVRNMK